MKAKIDTQVVSSVMRLGTFYSKDAKVKNSMLVIGCTAIGTVENKSLAYLIDMTRHQSYLHNLYVQ